MLLWALDATAEEAAGKIPVIAASSTGMGGFVSLVATTIPVTAVGSSDGDIFVWDSGSGTFVASTILSDLLDALTEFILRYEEWRQNGFQLPPPEPTAMIAALEAAGEVSI